MKTLEKYINIRRVEKILLLGVYILSNVLPVPASYAASGDKIVYPLKTISKLECRFDDYSSLSSSCKQDLPILKTKDYKKYATKNGGYNDFTRLYTVLWGASYKYGWDVGNGGHIGTDFATAKGTPILAMADGEVTIAKNLLGLGKTVTIKHTIRGKIIYSNYGHMSKIIAKKGQKVKAGQKIGEVGSTGNSTGNHLHFQIDLDTPFHPYYYDNKKCPYSYSQISESALCFDELRKNTIDPLLFLETKGKVLDDITVEVRKVSRKTINSSSKTVTTTTKKSNSYDMSIFDRTVHVGYSSSDIKKVQQIFGDLGEYNGPISGDYKDVEKAVISYQISNNIIKSKNDHGAGWFGPKTRAQAKHDYVNYLNNGNKAGEYTVEDNGNELTVNSKVKVEKISRSGMLSREEIEAREVGEFLRKYNLEFKMDNAGGNVKIGETVKLKLKITDKRGKAFKGNMPSGMTFIADINKLKVFPEKLYYFSDGKRDIKLTGLKQGSTTLYVKVGNKTIEQFPIRVYSSGQSNEVGSANMFASNSIIKGETKKGVVLFKDTAGKKLVDIKFDDRFKISTSEDTKVCIKKGNLKDLSRVYKKSCRESDYKDSIEFSYYDTVSGILVFDYKVYGSNGKIKIENISKNKELVAKNLKVNNPKDLKGNYVYKNEVVDLLEQGVVNGVNKGYFLQDRELVQSDALDWIENTLEQMRDDVADPAVVMKINKNLVNIKKERVSKFNPITRDDFLDYVYKYLVFDDNILVHREYRDLDGTQNYKVNAVFDQNTTWKDKFGENYYRPDVNLTRGEGAFFLAKAIQNNRKVFLTSR